MSCYSSCRDLFRLCGKAISGLSYLKCVLKVYESDFSGCSKVEETWEVSPHPIIFLKLPIIKPMLPHGAPLLKSEAPFQIMIPKKTPGKSTRTWFSYLEHLKLCKKIETVCLEILHYMINWKRFLKIID